VNNAYIYRKIILGNGKIHLRVQKLDRFFVAHLMKKIFLRIITSTSLIGLIVFLSIVLYPKTYNVPAFQKRIGTKYWDLSTGSRIGYSLIQSKGARKAYPIIFLQGGPGAPIFDANIEVLSKLADKGYDVYLYDLVGCGHSNRLANIEEYSVERHTKDLAEIIKKIGAEKVILIAQSWGALLATNYIADNEAKIEKVIFTGAGPILPINYDLEKMKAPDSLHLKSPLFTNAQGSQKTYNIRAKVVKLIAEKFRCKLAPENEMDNFATYLNFEMSKSTVVDTSIIKPRSGYGYYVSIKTAQSFGNTANRRKDLLKCEIPILMMKGQYDGVKWGYTDEYLKLFKNHQLVIVPKAGHSIALEQPELYLHTIAKFLSE
jgi:proline iminopeptidase